MSYRCKFGIPTSTLEICDRSLSAELVLTLRGGPLEIPGGGVKIPPKKFVQRKMPGKKFVQALRQRKKIRASKQQSRNSLEKKFVQRFNALKKIPAET
jgi:hypothetical protein